MFKSVGKLSSEKWAVAERLAAETNYVSLSLTQMEVAWIWLATTSVDMFKDLDQTLFRNFCIFSVPHMFLLKVYAVINGNYN